MAGMGWRQWTRERLAIDLLQSYLQDQVVQVYESASDRDAKLTAPADGMHAFLKSVGRTVVRVAGVWRDIGAQPRAHLYATAAQAGLPTGYSTINMGAALVDTHGGLNAGAFIVPAGQGGSYRLSGAVGIGAIGAGNASGITVGGRFIVNSAARVAAPPTLMPVSSVNGVVVPLVSTELALVPGDVVALQAYVNTGGWQTLAGNGAGASTSIMRLERIAS